VSAELTSLILMVAGLAIARIPNVQKRKSGASPLEGGSVTIGPHFVKHCLRF
jgi:hypothetical protein